MQKLEIIELLKKKFPNKWYSIRELAKEFSVSKDTIYYWIEKFEIPTFKVNNSPFIMQENLIFFLLRADEENQCEDRLVGFRYILEDIYRYNRMCEKLLKEKKRKDGDC